METQSVSQTIHSITIPCLTTRIFSESQIPKKRNWSRDFLHRCGNTDHWAKLKVRANSIKSADVTKRSSLSEFGPEKNPNKNVLEPNRHASAPSTAQHPLLNYRRSLDQQINAFTDDHLFVVVPKSGIQKHWLNNCYQQRAREGFRYWLINRPLPTSYGKYGFGSYKMFLGLGMAPRT
ncbi:unnamed protein product [Candidula unifasciata]|uniref:Uncharacterized protein n=1 Tax=Candidula unifasciata TaxID=100452 RepID=A0A8S3ZTW6_9EUPU|nr:unnamed protein product [Candidula unifasciata]